ncbi:MAG: hypothetical protein HFF79_07330 [Oscillospiraceae bacterium]|nr:hypothetical protein [Oscillospiraceae bacterium]MCI8878708.1 hypothetical protein [Oscillospiraceae bacterium]
MYRTPHEHEKVIDLTPRLRRQRLENLYSRLCTVFALWTQYAALGALLLYSALRLLLCPEIPPGSYVGPLFVLWPLSFLLLLASYLSDLLLWRE